MTRTMDEVEALARSGFRRSINGGSWAGGCQALVYNLGGFSRIYPTALACGNAASVFAGLDGNPDTGRRSEIHYYYGAGGDGHISFDYGNGLELMGSALAAQLGIDLGYDIAIVDGDLYRERAAVSYRGHSPYYGAGETLAPSTSTAGGGSSLILPNEKDYDMTYRLFSRNDNGEITLALGNLDPNWQTKGHNLWAEATLAQRADWVAQWGQPLPLRNDVWDSRSNDPNRISDITKFPLMFGQPAVVTGVTFDDSRILAALAQGDSRILAQLAAGEKQDVDLGKQILAALANVDEATLATFGLKRA